MTVGEAVVCRIQSLCSKYKISLNRLATISGITQSTLNNMVGGTSRNPTVSTVKKICDGLDMTLVEFFDDPIFHDLEQELK